MFVACHTLCYSKEPLDVALRKIKDLEFQKIDLAIVEDGLHLKPSEVAENLEAASQRIHKGPSMTPSSIGIDFGDLDPASPALKKRFDALCRLAKLQSVAVLTIAAAPLNSSFDDEVVRLSALANHAMRQGLVLAVASHAETLTALPAQAAALCKAVPGLGISLDPSHYIQGPNQAASYDDVFPYVQNVLLRDTGRKPGEFQVRVGQGEIEYSRIINLLERHGYDRGLTVSILDTLDSPFEVEVEVRKLKLLLESHL